MCDTLVALAGSTARGATLFAKNSDRERNEAQGLEMTPRRIGGGPLKLTYITIPDAPQTYACLLSRPFWMWGAEMGANEHGVAIGNEALHARTPAQRQRALECVVQPVAQPVLARDDAHAGVQRVHNDQVPQAHRPAGGRGGRGVAVGCAS